MFNLLKNEVIMIDIKFTEKEKVALHFERFQHPHPRVQRKMEALWLKSNEESHKRIAQLTGVAVNAVTRYIKEYQLGGIEKLKEINFRGPQSKLDEHTITIENYFKEHPPATIKEAMAKIEELTGLKRSEVQIWKFFRRIGLKCRKIGMIPSKVDIEKQETF